MFGKRLLFVVLVLGLIAPPRSATAQWGDPFASLQYGVQPACPFECDSATLVLSGELTSTSWSLPELLGLTRDGDSIDVRIRVAVNPDQTLPVLVPFQLSVPVGYLPEGHYRVFYTIQVENLMSTIPVIQLITVTDGFQVAPPGDQSCEGVVDVLDVVALVNHIFRGGHPPDPEKRADLNCDGRADISDLVQLVYFIFRGGSICDACDGFPPSPYGRLVSHSDCKGAIESSLADVSSDQDCLVWDYGEDSVLILRHLNTGFNCCPDSITAVFAFVGDTVTIGEVEWLSAPCDCLCLYDLEYRIAELPSGTWTIRIVQPYLWQGAAPLEFTVDLNITPSGQFCVTRDHYPWGQP